MSEWYDTTGAHCAREYDKFSLLNRINQSAIYSNVNLPIYKFVYCIMQMERAFDTIHVKCLWSHLARGEPSAMMHAAVTHHNHKPLKIIYNNNQNSQFDVGQCKRYEVRPEQIIYLMCASACGSHVAQCWDIGAVDGKAQGVSVCVCARANSKSTNVSTFCKWIFWFSFLSFLLPNADADADLLNAPPAEYYKNGHCHACHSTCETCNGPTEAECLTCASPLLLQNNKCVSACDDGYYIEAGICAKCLHTCTQCVSRMNCSACAKGLQLQSGECRTTCADG